MKKILTIGLLFAFISSLYAVELNNQKASWVAFKTPAKVGVKGSFQKVDFTFKKDAKDIKELFTNAKAVVELSSSSTEAEERDKTIYDNFFSLIKGKNATITIKDVIEGENLGTMLANVNLNGVTKNIPMKYTIKDNKIMVEGTIDMMDFSLNKAYQAIAKACFDLHEKVTWTQVQLVFEANIK